MLASLADRECDACGTRARPMRKCEPCGTHYCCVECQHHRWREHRLHCRRAARRAAERQAARRARRSDGALRWIVRVYLFEIVYVCALDPAGGGGGPGRFRMPTWDGRDGAFWDVGHEQRYVLFGDEGVVRDVGGIPHWVQGALGGAGWWICAQGSHVWDWRPPTWYC